MRLKGFKTLFIFVSTLANLWGCSTTQVRERKRERIEVCVPDSRNNALQCALSNGDKITRDFGTLPIGKYMCFQVDEITKILESE